MSKPVPLELTEAQDWDGAKRIAIASFLSVLMREETKDRLDNKEVFSRFLNDSLTRFELSAAQLSVEKKISKAAVSKWMHGLAMPSAPTRETIINWVKEKLENQMADLLEKKSNPERPVKTSSSKKRHLSLA